ncbi:hypothetical protein GQ44DRAFT_731311 [Phaeosphaeriaceae sp. PMI808]|nr:hypothetical protein GQ44DRAFT_731311 [Phaeosphaeriaceae sp. PMI808]
MDPISAVAGVISIVAHAERVSKALSTSSKRSHDETNIKLELEIYTTILEEVAHIALSGSNILPRSATLSLQLCEHHLSRLDSLIQDVFAKNESFKKTRVLTANKFGELEKVLKHYRRAVKILRDVVME